MSADKNPSIFSRQMETIVYIVLLLKTYTVLRKNPPKIKRGNISGGPRDVAAVIVGASVDTI